MGLGGVERVGMPRPVDDSQIVEEKVHRLVDQWKAAKNESDRREIEQELRDAVKGQFNARLAPQRKELEELESQVKQLREKLELRLKKQDEIVDFRVQQLLREAQGLGWGTEPETPTRGGFPGGLPSPSPAVSPWPEAIPVR